MSEILKDSRFTKYLKDPRYRQIPKHERKVKIDNRFESMFKDEKFKVKYTIDKRGRPINETSTENLRKYYDLEESDGTSSDDEGIDVKKLAPVDLEAQELDPEDADTSGRFVRLPPSEDFELSDTKIVKNDQLVRGKLDHKTKAKLLDLDVDYARGEGTPHLHLQSFSE